MAPTKHLKQYVVKRDYNHNKKDWQKYEIVWMAEKEAIPYVAQHVLIPFATAINDGLWPPPAGYPKKKTSTVPVVTQEELEQIDNIKPTDKNKSEPKSKPKTLIGNQLRDAIQKKKAESATKNATPTPKSTNTTSKSAAKPTGDDKPKTDSKPKSSTPKGSKKISNEKLSAIKAGGKK